MLYICDCTTIVDSMAISVVKTLYSTGDRPAFSWNDDQRSFALIKMVREGIPFGEFMALSKAFPFTTKEWAIFLNITVRTLERHKAENKTFRQEQSEKILSIYQLLNYGSIVFEDSERFFIWLAAKNIALGGIAPKELMDTNIGIHMVRDELGRLEHGILA